MSGVSEFVNSDGEEKQSVSFEAFQRLSYEEKYDFVTVWMENLVKSITNLAKAISLEQIKRNEFESMLKGIVNSKELAVVKGEMIVKDLVKCCLNGEHSFYDVFFVKEKNPLKRLEM
jgi:Glu-tRNA(Gln) amidotransferase subunit E-like FAD-binding protein